jgi:hypothetical protein
MNRILKFLRPQPEPLQTRVTHLRTAVGWVTTIYRAWGPGDTGPDGACRLCRECVAYSNGCMVSILTYVPRDEAPLFSILDPKYIEQSEGGGR